MDDRHGLKVKKTAIDDAVIYSGPILVLRRMTKTLLET